MKSEHFFISFRMIRSLIIFLILAFSLVSCRRTSNGPEENYVVVLSLDGFRWNYPDRFPIPNLDRLADGGMKAEALIPCFPTKTFPNHYSMATGLYPDHHGIILNGFYDPEMDAFFRMDDRSAVENAAFYGGEPIWVTAEKQGIQTASYSWVGTEAPVMGIHPSTWKRYEHWVPFAARIDSVISWLRRPPEVRPRLIMFYMDEPDSRGHVLGPEGPSLGNTITWLDEFVGDLAEKLDGLGIAGRINLIVTSDHGMGAISPDKYTDLADHIPPHWVALTEGYNPNMVIKAREGYYDSIQTVIRDIPHVSGWPGEEVPDRLVYGTHRRTLDFVMLADSAWSIGWQRGPGQAKGAHGYDNANTDMHTIFYATGPDFKPDHVHPPFMNIDIYSLIAHLLGLQPALTDGSLENVRSMMRE
jgi:alkaline phosphatase D